MIERFLQHRAKCRIDKLVDFLHSFSIDISSNQCENCLDLSTISIRWLIRRGHDDLDLDQSINQAMQQSHSTNQ